MAILYEVRKKLQKKLKFKNIEICPDTEIAFSAAFERYEINCGILIAGTGSVLYFKDKNGKILKIGGWGHVLGDHGSAYQIGLNAVKAIVGHFDREGRWPKLGAQLLRALQLNLRQGEPGVAAFELGKVFFGANGQSSVRQKQERIALAGLLFGHRPAIGIGREGRQIDFSDLKLDSRTSSRRCLTRSSILGNKRDSRFRRKSLLIS